MRAMFGVATVLTLAGALVAAGNLQAPAPRVVNLTAVDAPVVLAPAVKRLADSLRLAVDGATRFCATNGAPLYMRQACLTLVAVNRRLDEVAATAFVIARDGPVLTASYASGVNGWPAPGVDTVTICGLVHYANHAERVVWPPVRIKVLGDSLVAWGLRSGNPLEQMCSRSFPLAALAGRDSLPVTWVGAWVTIDGRRLYRPTFTLPTP